MLSNLMSSPVAFADSLQNATKTNLEVVVDGVSNDRGNVRMVVFSEADAGLFPDHFPPLRQSIAATDEAITFHFNNLIAGRYAILVFQDENGNEILDRNLLGIPKERWGITGKRPFGSAPRFEESTFVLDSKHQKITIHLE